MKDYLKYVKFGMRYRICEDTLTTKDGPWHWGDVYYWKYIPELKDLWPFNSGNSDSYPVGGEYAKCWKAITGKDDQSPDGDDLKKAVSNCRSKEYFYWEGSYHKRYGQGLCDALGDAQLGLWYDRVRNMPLTYRESGIDRFGISTSYQIVSLAYTKYAAQLSTVPGGVSLSWLYSKLENFAKRNKLNVHNLVKWQEGHDLEAWKAQDKELRETAKKAEKSFAAIKSLIQKEIKDIENMENGSSSWTGDDEDPVFDPNDEEVMKNPDAAAKKARAKWATMKANLKKKLVEIDNAAVSLRNEWESYKTAVAKFEGDRKAENVVLYFAESCINMLVRTKDRTIFDEGKDASFRISAGCNPYDIGKGTRDMLAKTRDYYDKLVKSYNLEVEYGAMLGLESAGKAKREGKSPDEIVDGADGVDDDTPGSLGPGSDTGNIIDKDRQTYRGGAWKWN